VSFLLVLLYFDLLAEGSVICVNPVSESLRSLDSYPNLAVCLVFLFLLTEWIDANVGGAVDLITVWFRQVYLIN
jgi:hypothetical protein